MRYLHAGAGIGLVLGAFALQGPAAVAADDSDIHIRPGHVSPGSTVTVSTTACGPDVTYGKGESAAGGLFHLFEGDRAGVLTGSFRIPEGAGPDRDTVTVKCPPSIRITDTYKVSRRYPRGGVDAGFGPAREEFGAVLLAGVAAGGALMRRRTSIRR